MSAQAIEEVRPGYFRVNGDLTFATVQDLLKLASSLYNGQTDVEVDLSNVERADSAGVALLIEWVKFANQHGVLLEYRNAPEQLKAITAVSQLEPVLPLGGSTSEP